MEAANPSGGNGVEDHGNKGSIEEMIENSSREIVKEIHDQMTIVLIHFVGLEKDLELVQKNMGL